MRASKTTLSPLKENFSEKRDAEENRDITKTIFTRGNRAISSQKKKKETPRVSELEEKKGERRCLERSSRSVRDGKSRINNNLHNCFGLMHKHTDVVGEEKHTVCTRIHLLLRESL